MTLHCAVSTELKCSCGSVWVFPRENPETHLDSDNFYGRVYMTALEGVSRFGRAMRETTQAGSESRHEGQNSNPTVRGTGTARDEREGECVHVIERIGRGERI